GAADACDGLLVAVHAFAAGVAQSDDITVFAIDCSMPPVSAGLSLRLRVPDERDRLPDAMDVVTAMLGKAGFHASRVHDAQVIVEELVCNLMDHGAPAGVDALVLGFAIDDRRMLLEVRDNGAAYDPLAHPPPDLDGELEQRPIGGLGIHLVRELSQEAGYRREDGWNVLRIVLDDILPAS
ncbi:MAG TPA: ATP-binding protein, partial [Thermomonas sp.]|nr:ATP-binding protein [Thermomonas sp.]